MHSHASHIINIHPEYSNNVCDYCPENSCSNLDVAERKKEGWDGGCDCQCYVCDPDL